MSDDDLNHKVISNLIDENKLYPWLIIEDIEDKTIDEITEIIHLYRDQTQKLIHHIIDLNKPRSKNKEKNYIYVMIDHNTGYHKIGRSVKPKHRERTLQSEKPTIDMIVCIKSDEKEEDFLHRKFIDKRIRGEWFDLNDKDIEYIKNHLSK